ncbi:MAG: PilW family protein [Proteobacteria bacterium]|nr:PilW family protein [Pseudomonadota bacterium]
MKRLRDHRGFTLVELMVALVLFAFAVAGILSFAVTMANGFREQKQVVGTETSARAAMEFIGDAIRGASPGVTTENIESFHTCADGPFAMTDSTVAPDDLTLVFAYGSVVTSSTSLFTKGATTLDVADATQFSAGDWVLLSNYSQGHLVQINTVVSATQLSMKTSPTCTLSVPFPNGDTAYSRGALVIRVARARFFIAPLDGIPTLWMDPDAEGLAAAEPLAEGVEDFQVELGIDPGNNGIAEVGVAANDDEWIGNVAGDTPLGLGVQVRAVRITLVARSTNQVSGTAGYLRPAAGNRPISGTPDNYRRRVLRSVIEVRNAGGSP